MSAYNPPSEDITQFNSSLFNQPTVSLSQAEADLLYLSKTKTDISTAGLTTFNGQVNVGGNITGSSLIQSNTTSASTNAIYNNLFTGSTLAIGTANSTNTINGNTNFGSNITFRNRYKLIEYLNIDTNATFTLTFPLAQTYVIRTSTSPLTIELPTITTADAGYIIRLVKVVNNINITLTSPGAVKIISLDDLGSGGVNSNTTLLASDKLQTTLVAGFYLTTVYWLEFSDYSTFDRNLLPKLAAANAFTNTGTNSFAGQVSINNRLTFTPASYSFPFASSQSLGYYLKELGTPTSVTSGVSKTILTTSTIPIGVWLIHFSVLTTVISAGTITRSNNYVSPTLDGAVTTAVDFTGSVIRTHVSEVYTAGDIQEVTSSFTYQQTTAGVLRLNVLRGFATGSYDFTGEISITRIA